VSARRFIVSEADLVALLKRHVRHGGPHEAQNITDRFLASHGALVTKVIEADRGATAKMPAHYHEWETKHSGVPGIPNKEICKTCGAVR
jgi:hypothetical protein